MLVKAKTKQEKFSNAFLLIILVGVLYFCFILFRPFLKEIAIAGILVTIFYPAYLKIVFYTRGRLALSSLVICLLILLLVMTPFTLILFYLAQQAIKLYGAISPGLNTGAVQLLDAQIWQKINFIDPNIFDLQKFVIDSLAMVQGYILSGASVILRSTSQFVVSLILVFFTMFFLFLDGRYLLRRIMQLTPLSNKYDKLIWMKFRDVSFTTIVASFITAITQSIVAAIGFFIVGLPGLIAAVFVFLFAFFPYVGTAFVWLPVAIYLLIIGQLWQGIFLILWGSLVISLIDNFLRPYLIKGKAQVHPLIIFFSIFGGLFYFGFWGMIFGPLIVALTVTILHIYELQYSELLER